MCLWSWSDLFFETNMLRNFKKLFTECVSMSEYKDVKCME